MQDYHEGSTRIRPHLFCFVYFPLFYFLSFLFLSTSYSNVKPDCIAYYAEGKQRDKVCTFACDCRGLVCFEYTFTLFVRFILAFCWDNCVFGCVLHTTLVAVTGPTSGLGFRSHHRKQEQGFLPSHFPLNLHPSYFPHVLSLSLSLTHTHTHTHSLCLSLSFCMYVWEYDSPVFGLSFFLTLPLSISRSRPLFVFQHIDCGEIKVIFRLCLIFSSPRKDTFFLFLSLKLSILFLLVQWLRQDRSDSLRVCSSFTAHALFSLSL